VEPNKHPLKNKPHKDRGGKPVRVMIVDDSLTVRTVFSRMIEGDPALSLVTTASNAERAIALLREKPVDVILLDLEMPGMGGLEALPRILSTASNAQVLVVSSLTEDGAEHTLAALSMGAADTMPKPRPGGFDDAYRASLLAKIHALGGLDSEPRSTEISAAQPSAPVNSAVESHHRKTPEVVAIGASTGGIHALNIILRGLPRKFDLPILVTQHLPASFIPVFARQVEMAAARRAVIADDGTEIRRGEIAVATAHGHMVIDRQGDRLIARTSNSPARSGCLPSVDPMLASLAHSTRGHAIGVILSGMGRDGVEGAAELAASGGIILAQDAESSAVWGMPGAVAKAGLASAILPPERLLKEVLAIAGVSAWR
jgi:two-component system chemotaxis response regulator CheB